jgi:putative ABC transport system substrate-binding protein
MCALGREGTFDGWPSHTSASSYDAFKNLGAAVKRREIMALLGGAGMSPLTAGAQQKRLPLIAVLFLPAPGDYPFLEDNFYKPLDTLGWTRGKSVRIEVRWAGGDAAKLERYAAELVALEPDVILANGNPAVLALKKLTSSIPIVCALVQAPVELGLVKSLARPGGNITGFSYITPEIYRKWGELLGAAAPSTKRAGLFFNPALNPQFNDFLRDLGPRPQGAIDIVASPVQTVETLRAAMAELGRTEGGAAILAPDAFLYIHRKEAVSLALEYRMPTIATLRQFVAEGGLMSYAPSTVEIIRRSVSYLDRILRGEKPGELPVQQPDRYEFVISLRTAKALGLAVPPTLLALADEVIE